MAPSEQHPYFPSCDWEGFYKDPRSGRPKGEMSMTLEFFNGMVTGSGSDPVGVYIWAGNYDTKIETCQLRKTYVGGHTVEYSGYADENGIWGNWKLVHTKGEFHIWPKKRDMDVESEKLEETLNEEAGRFLYI